VAFEIGLELFNKSLPAKFDFYLLLMIVAIEAIIWGRKVKYERWKRASLLFSGIGFLYIAGISLLYFYSATFQAAFISPNFILFNQMGIVTVLTSIFMCDTGAYAIGSAIGKHHFSSISPKKTIEGTVGGFLCAILFCEVGWYFFGNTAFYPRYLGIILGVVIGIFSILGDLLVSLMKRYFGVKDSSDIIPGHGGILDRFSSLFFAAPMINLFFWIVNKLAG
jgi:phosphatidate cytidylyltransferase